MSTIIKAGDRQRSQASVPFNLDDVRIQAEQYLAKIREQAGQILLDARREADALRAQAEQAGRRAGEASLEPQIAARLQAALDCLTPALAEAVGEVQRLRGTWLAQWESQVVRLAAAIAGRIVRRELRHDPQLPLAWIRESLELASGPGRLRVRLHPNDHALLGDNVQRIIAELARLGPTDVVADPAVAPGGCRVESEQGSIDQQIETQLARIVQELS